MDPVDLDRLPVLKCWPGDGGPFITLPCVFTKDPDTGIRNMGTYRMQVFDKQTTGMHWQIHKGGAKHFQRYQELAKKIPVAVTLGGDPVLPYAATLKPSTPCTARRSSTTACGSLPILQVPTG